MGVNAWSGDRGRITEAIAQRSFSNAKAAPPAKHNNVILSISELLERENPDDPERKLGNPKTIRVLSSLFHQ